MKYFIGIDPGAKGGVSIINQRGELTYSKVMPLKDDGHVNYKPFLELKERPSGEYFLVVEKVWGYFGQGSTSIFSFGRSTGQVIGIFETLFDLHAVEVAAQTWQRAILGSVENTKKASAEYAKRVFNNDFLATKRSKISHSGLTDSVCIAQYLRLNWERLI